MFDFGNHKIKIFGKEFDYFEVYYRIWKKWSTVSYHFLKIFKPWNVIRIQKLPNEYTDRDNVMFHAIFQCLVDFVELEHDYIPWSIRDSIKGRFTDIDVMYSYIQEMISPEGLASYCADWYSDEEVKKQNRDTHQLYKIKMEILYLYAWYKQERYLLDPDLIFHIDLSDITKQLFGDDPKHRSTQRKILLTNREYWETEEERDLVCDHMLRRVLAVRRYLWT